MNTLEQDILYRVYSLLGKMSLVLDISSSANVPDIAESAKALVAECKKLMPEVERFIYHSTNVSPADKNWVDLPNGFGLFCKEDPHVGRIYYSDEIGGGIEVWTPALVQESTLLAAIVQEHMYRAKEQAKLK